ncbi:MAG: nuclear transport factor 2 family protein [Pseudomonadota bacterium]
MAIKEAALALLSAVFIDYDADAATKLLAPDYIQHNPNLPTGAAAITGAIPALEEAGLTVETHRIFAEGDFVVMHNTYTNAEFFGAPTLVAVDVLRMEDGVFVEHWDNLQIPPEVTASGRSMTDGPTEITDLDKTADNKAVVEGFVNDIFLGGKLDKAADYIISEPGAYAQHNPLVPDGLESLEFAFKNIFGADPTFTIHTLHLIVAEGNFVFTATEGVLGGEPTAFFDIWRLEGGKIVEHWDVIESIPGEMAHDNGKF